MYDRKTWSIVLMSEVMALLALLEMLARLVTISFCDIDCQSEKQIGIHVLTDKSSLEETTIQFGEQKTLILDQSDSDDGYNSMDSESNSRMFDASDVSNKNSYRSIGSITSERNEELKNYASSMYDASDVSYNDSDRSIGSISSEWNEDYENYSSSLYGASGVSNNGSYRSIGSISSERNEEIKNYDSSMYGASDHSNNHSYSSMYSMSSARTEDFDYSNISMYGTSDLRNNNYLNIENAISDVEFHIDDSDCPNGNSKNTSVGIKCKMNSTATDDKEWYKPMERKKECLTVTVSPTQESAEGESDHHIRIKEMRQLVLSIGEQYIIIYDVKEGLRTIKKKGLQTLKGNRILIEGCSLKLLIQGKYDIKAVQVGNVNRVQIIT
ncbi:hypothetical protein MAR_032175 [Mya arenaria]|uniref:Uncharacterized protein n=1 Tax=Mya arenaria TaxID=6604 RepID=A0ABY7F9A0_MYAAR|nr:hypothetical protein MAR_032175 [Mya arenaria]